MVALVALVPTVALAQDAGLEGDLDGIEADRERTERELEDVREREGDARERLAALEAELEETEEQLAALEEQLEAARAIEAEAREAAETARASLTEVRAELEETEEALDAAQVLLQDRARAAFKYGQVSFLEAFTGTQDIVDFLNSGAYVSRVLEVDKELVEEVTDLLALVEQQRAEAQQLRLAAEREAAIAVAAADDVARAVEEQERLTEELDEQIAAREAVFEELREDRAAIEAHLEGLEAESGRIEDQLAEIARQQAAEQARIEEEQRQADAAEAAERERQAAAGSSGGSGGGSSAGSGSGPSSGSSSGSGSGSSSGSGSGSTGGSDASSGSSAGGGDAGGGWLRPASGRLSSGYGSRWGRFHHGVDIAAPIGTGVMASRAGTVVHVTNGCNPTSSPGCGGGFGNYIVVSHHGGMATLYAHLSSVDVGSGTRVSAGQRIGAIGNSGNSTGPHLHFEVRQAGSSRNPCGYISC